MRITTHCKGVPDPRPDLEDSGQAPEWTALLPAVCDRRPVDDCSTGDGPDEYLERVPPPPV
jgi:hypothetical protein